MKGKKKEKEVGKKERMEGKEEYAVGTFFIYCVRVLLSLG